LNQLRKKRTVNYASSVEINYQLIVTNHIVKSHKLRERENVSS